MSSRDPERSAQLSVLDRLIDTEPRVAADPPLGWTESVRRVKRSLLRDLEWLLNTRRIADVAPDRYPEVQRSVYHFGLPDITSLSGDSEAVRRRLLRQVEDTIETFEPRLADVHVSPVESDDENRRRIRFVIEGVLRMEPNPEHVVFDTVLETTSGEFAIGGAHG